MGQLRSINYGAFLEQAGARINGESGQSGPAKLRCDTAVTELIINARPGQTWFPRQQIGTWHLTERQLRALLEQAYTQGRLDVETGH